VAPLPKGFSTLPRSLLPMPFPDPACLALALLLDASVNSVAARRCQAVGTGPRHL